MKKTIALVFTLIFVVAMFVGCGSKNLDMSKVEGTWDYSAIAGIPFAEYCEKAGTTVDAAQATWEISADKIVSKNAAGEGTLTVSPAEGGFNATQPDGTAIGVHFDEEKDILWYEVQDGNGGTIKYEMSRVAE